MIDIIQFECEDMELTAVKPMFQYSNTKILVTALKVDEEKIIEVLNFADVMQYYGIKNVLKWVEENK